jgi:hypothetical protein
MKWYVLMLCLLVGVVWGVSAQQADPGLVGDWETNDGNICKPCVLKVQQNGTMKFFDTSGTEVEIFAARVTPEPGVDLMLPLGGKLELGLAKNSNMLVGTYTDRFGSHKDPVAFRRK